LFWEGALTTIEIASEKANPSNAIQFCDDLLPEVHVGEKCNYGAWVFSVRDSCPLV
jgi:hypothetical protein